MCFKNFVLKKEDSNKLCCFPLNEKGVIIDYDDNTLDMPSKIIEMGLIPDTEFKILHKAPFNGPLYIEFGVENSRIALREEEARFIVVKSA